MTWGSARRPNFFCVLKRVIGPILRCSISYESCNVVGHTTPCRSLCEIHLFYALNLAGCSPFKHPCLFYFWPHFSPNLGHNLPWPFFCLQGLSKEPCLFCR